jgi:hypothetical protein
MLKQSLLIACFIVSAQIKADQLTNFTAHFDISVAGIPAGESVYSFKQHDGQFQLQMVSSATGLFKLFLSDQYVLTSQFRLSDEKVTPLLFTDEKTGEDEKLVQTFNWDQHIVDFENQDEQKQLELKPDTQDVLSYHVLLPKRLKQGLKQFEFPVAEGKKLKSYQIKVLAEETLDTDIGRFKAIKLTRIQSDQRETYVWLAPELNYIPIQAVHIENGFTIKAEITALDSSV